MEIFFMVFYSFVVFFCPSDPLGLDFKRTFMLEMHKCTVLYIYM